MLNTRIPRDFLDTTFLTRRKKTTIRDAKNHASPPPAAGNRKEAGSSFSWKPGAERCSFLVYLALLVVQSAMKLLRVGRSSLVWNIIKVVPVSQCRLEH